MNTNSENYVIVRADKAGVFFGQLIKKENNEVTLSNCRKLFYWDGACAVEQIALDGIQESAKSNCKFTVTVENVVINNYIQIIPCSEKSIESIKSILPWKR